MASRDRSGGPTMFARIGVMRALNRKVERVFNPDRKDHQWGRRKLSETNDARRPQCFVVFFSSVMTSLMSGSSPSLHLHGIPAPHWQPSLSSQARIGVLFADPPYAETNGQFLSIAESYLW